MTLFSPAFQREMSQKGGVKQTWWMSLYVFKRDSLFRILPEGDDYPSPPFSLYSWTNSPTWKSPSAQLLCHPSRIRVLFYVCMYTNANCQTRWRQTFYVTQQTKFYTAAKWYTKAFHHRLLHFSFNGSRFSCPQISYEERERGRGRWVVQNQETPQRVIVYTYIRSSIWVLIRNINTHTHTKWRKNKKCTRHGRSGRDLHV